ncbi:MAG: LPS assembly protein LptD [Pseudomonadota bacterium]
MIKRSQIIALTFLGTVSLPALAFAVQERSPLAAGNTDETVLFSAEKVTRHDDSSPIFAEGNVKAFFGTQTLVADRVTYNPDTDIVTAAGNVTIFDEMGQTYYADEVELTGDLKDGVATNFAALLAPQSRLAGANVVRRSNGTTDLKKAAYTACSVCKENGDKKRPTWQVKAGNVTRDTNTETIKFRNATIQAFGVPVAYTPYLQLPDPSAKRKSGLLIPSLSSSTAKGFEIEVPYYWAISDYQDATFSPRYFQELGTLYQGEYRVRTHNGGAVIQAGIIDPRDDDDDVLAPSFRNASSEARWHIFADGFKELENDWWAEFNIDWVSDKLYLRRYDVEAENELREAIDRLQPDRLENELSLVRRRDNSYTEISTVLFQTLRTREDNDFMGDALPRFRHEERHDAPLVGGDITYSTDFLYLHRPQGLDSARVSLNADYNKSYTTQNGHRLRGFAQVRGDYYRYTDANRGTQACNVNDANYETCRTLFPRNSQEEAYSTTRFLPTVGVEWSYPLAKLTDNATIIIEPRVQAVVSPTEDFADDIFNEDSGFFQFDSVTLFDWNKSPGLDQWEDGQRLNVGISGTAILDDNITLSGSIGQQFRTDISAAFDEDTGLGDQSSDYVGDFTIAYGGNFKMDNRFRLDDEDGTLRRAESAVSARVGPFATNLSYLRVETPTFQESGRRDEFLTTTATYQVNDRWLVGANWRENLVTGDTTGQSLILRYRDDCALISLNYRFDNQRGNNDEFGGNRSFTLNFDLIGF